MKAGIDFGSSLVKAVWKEDDYRFASTAEEPLERIVRKMKNAGVKRLRMTGIGHKAIDGFELMVKEGDPITNEITLQAEGTKRILELDGVHVEDFLLVSIGTGTSYTFVDGKGERKFPFGNPISGGFIMGIGKKFGAKDFNKISLLASYGTPADLLVKDLLPETAESFEGNLVVANFGKADSSLSPQDFYASVLHCVAVATTKDILTIGMIKDFEVPENIIYVGSTLSCQTLKEMLSNYALAVGKSPHFPSRGEFAHAMGAYHVEDSLLKAV